MSETFFYIIPADPRYLPDQQTQAAALELFNEVLPFPEGDVDMNKVKIFSRPEFIDAGEYLQSAICPNCNSTLDFWYGQQYEHWWDELQDKIWNSELESKIVMPCCNRETRLVDLSYIGTSGFAQFALEAEPCFESDVWDGFLLKQPIIERFEKLLGCSVLQVVERR